MADFDKPDNLSDYANVWDYVKAVQESLSLWQDGTTDTNIPTDAKRYSSTNKRFETYNGTSWEPLIPLDTDQANAYQIRVAKANSADSADLATNATNLVGVAGSQFVQTTDTRMADARQCNNTFANKAASRTGLDVYSKYDVTMFLLSKADLASPALTGAPTAPTAAAGTNTTQLATTAFATTVSTTKAAEAAAAAAAAAVLADVGPWVNITLSAGATATACRYRLLNSGKNIQFDISELDVSGVAYASTGTVIASGAGFATDYYYTVTAYNHLGVRCTIRVGGAGSIRAYVGSTGTVGDFDFSMVLPT